MKLILIQRVLPRYRHGLMEAMREEARQAGLEFEVWHSAASDSFARRGTAGALEWARVLPVLGIARPFVEWQRLPWREVIAADVLVVPDNTRVLSNVAVLLTRKLLGKPVVTWGHGANFQPGGLSRYLSPVRYLLLRLAAGQLVYTDTCVAPLVAHAFDRTRIKTTGNAVDASSAADLSHDHPDVQAFRRDHGLAQSPCVAFLGSWYARKRPELIIQFGNLLRREVPEAQVLVLGGGDGLDVLRQARLPWLHLLGPLHDRAKFVALHACRSLVVSGVGGLNILDAMACGLPVVAPIRKDHSPEIVFLQHGVNGFLVPDRVADLVFSAAQLCVDAALFTRMTTAARETAAGLTVTRMANKLVQGALQLSGVRGGAPPSRCDVVVVYQRMLPYHAARFRTLSARLAGEGKRCVAVQVTSFDSSYGQIGSIQPVDASDTCEVVTLFPHTDYLVLTAAQVSRAMYTVLRALSPATVFCPAPAFSEGAGALHYKVKHGGRLILMDDAWSETDRRGRLTRAVKRAFHGYVDGGFFPAPLHGEYFASLRIPPERQRWAVDVVEEDSRRPADVLPDAPTGPFFVFVGRLIRRKGLDVVLQAMAGMKGNVPRLVVIGDGPERKALEDMAAGLQLQDSLVWLGRCSNPVSRAWIRKACALLVPSDFEQWALVVNEAWIEGTPVLGTEAVGALRAACPPELRWTMVPVRDVAAMRSAMLRMLSLCASERKELIRVGKQLAARYSLDRHVQSALELMDLPVRRAPLPMVGWAARLWRGRVAVW